MIKKAFLFVSLLIFSSSTWSSQNLLKVMGTEGLSRSFRLASRNVDLPVRLASSTILNDQSQVSERGKTMQIFSRPTYDRIAKYVLSQDELVRIDILKAFTGISSLSSAIQLDEHYNPFDPLHNLRKIINASSSKTLFETIRNSTTVEISLDGKKNKQAAEMLKGLSGLYSDLAHAFPNHRHRSSVDFLCETDFGYITIEFQVAKQDHWDKRALAYISSIYGNQLRPKQDYDQIQDVIGINLLGEGSIPYWKDGNFIRDYILVDQRSSKNKIPSLRLIQYSLGDVDLNHPDLQENDKLKQWIEFFKSAHEKQSTPPSVDESVKKAYEMIRVDTLKAQHPELLKASDDFFSTLTEHDKAVEEKGVERVAKNFLKDGMSLEAVARNTGLSLEQLKKLSN
jgi:predicted transposase/invertase (TIGR01784 family)